MNDERPGVEVRWRAAAVTILGFALVVAATVALFKELT